MSHPVHPTSLNKNLLKRKKQSSADFFSQSHYFVCFVCFETGVISKLVALIKASSSQTENRNLSVSALSAGSKLYLMIPAQNTRIGQTVATLNLDSHPDTIYKVL